jgi:hypothetical protein
MTDFTTAADATTTEHRWLCRFTPGEIAQFATWISTSPADDLARHAQRLASAVRLGSFDGRTRQELERRLEARRNQLTTRTP